MHKKYSWNRSTCICHNDKYLKSIADTAVIARDEFIYVMDIVSTNITNIMPVNMSTNFDAKKIRYKMDWYNLLIFLLVIKLLFIVPIFSYHHAKHRSKLKRRIAVPNIWKWRIMNLKKGCNKNRTCYKWMK